MPLIGDRSSSRKIHPTTYELTSSVLPQELNGHLNSAVLAFIPYVTQFFLRGVRSDSFALMLRCTRFFRILGKASAARCKYIFGTDHVVTLVVFPLIVQRHFVITTTRYSAASCQPLGSFHADDRKQFQLMVLLIKFMTTSPFLLLIRCLNLNTIIVPTGSLSQRKS